MDDQLERLMNDVQRTGQALLGHDTVRIVPNMAELARANDAARSVLRSYLSEDTRRLDWLENKKARGVVYDSTQRQVIFRWPVAEGIRAKIDSHRRAAVKESADV